MSIVNIADVLYDDNIPVLYQGEIIKNNKIYYTYSSKKYLKKEDLRHPTVLRVPDAVHGISSVAGNEEGDGRSPR
tara:strand:+ start:572 stop:796 length:225 start_codon:yes stop_codon:yes gene_type:complete